MVRVVGVRDEDGAVRGCEAHHLGGKQPFRPDVVEGVGAGDEPERRLREGQRRVRVAADGLAARRRESAREPELRERQIRENGRAGRDLGERPRQVSGSAADVDRASRLASDGGRDRAHDGVRDDEGGIGKSIEKVAAFESRTERLDEIAEGRAGRSGHLLEALRPPIVLEREHLARGAIGPALLDERARGDGRRLEVHDRYAGHYREHAAVAPEDRIVDLVSVEPVK